MRRVVALLIPASVVMAAPAMAQDPDRKVTVNFGGGVSFPVGDSASVYFEARYHYIWGSDVTDSTGKSYGKANGQFFPITGGIRFWTEAHLS
jgi:hypothetical protein